MKKSIAFNHGASRWGPRVALKATNIVNSSQLTFVMPLGSDLNV